MGVYEYGWHTEGLRPETARHLLYAIVVVCLALTATFAVFRPPATPAQEGVPFAHTAQSGVDQIGGAFPLVFVPSASNAQLRPVRIPPLRFQIAVDNGAPVPSSVTPTSYPRACACSHET